MKIKIWGCRGSIASPGPDTLRYGGDTTCLELDTDEGRKIIIDAGSGIRRLGNQLIKDKSILEVILLMTHAHWDHMAGFPFFRPAYSPDFTIYICGGVTAQNSILDYLKHQMAPPYFPVEFSVMKANFRTGCGCDKQICAGNLPDTGNSFVCQSIPLNHPNGGYGFKFTENNNSFVFLTDNEIRYHHEGGMTRDEYIKFSGDADLLIHDAQYTETEYKWTKSWGHSTYQDAVDLALDAGVKRLGLYHHDPDRTDEQIDRFTDRCREYILKKGSSLECFACADGMELKV